MRGLPALGTLAVTVCIFTEAWAAVISRAITSRVNNAKAVQSTSPDAEGVFSLVLYLMSAGKGKNIHPNTGKQTWIQPGAEFKTFAHYSEAAYSLKSKSWNCIPGCQKPETAGTVVDFTWHNNSPASVGYIAHNDLTGIIVVSFRGSADTQDWIQDSEFTLDSWPKHIPGSMVHHGFLSAYNSVAGNVTSTVLKLAKQYPEYKVVFTGHSLGGAETVMCAVDILDKKPELKRRTFVYTYGMPRVGNDAWADGIDRLGIPIYRMVYESDLVPHIPFQWLGYQHFAQEVWIHSNRTHFCGKEQESLKCSAGVAISEYNILDHRQYSPGNWRFSL